MNPNISQQFPILSQRVNGEPLIYLDNAATTQKPHAVLEAMLRFYQEDNANIHRGVHTLSQRATALYEKARQVVAQFIHADVEEVIFTSGTTAGLNFIARGLVEPQLKVGDQIVVTILEHHSNLVPWQMLAKRVGAQLVYAPLTQDYQIDLAALSPEKIKVIAIHHVSNVLGVEQPIADIVAWARQHDILVVVDGAQAVAHQPVNVHQLGVDAYCFSGHKLYGPTGVGVCYLAKRYHHITEPVHYGGEMIYQVGDYESNFKAAPWKFEGGTPPIAQVVGLQQAIEWLTQFDWSMIETHEQQLTQHLAKGLRAIDGVTVYGANRGIVSFNLEGIHPHDVATAFDMEGIAVRAGHHCAQPLMRHLQVQATVRASVALYNTCEEVEHFIMITRKIKEFFENGIG